MRPIPTHYAHAVRLALLAAGLGLFLPGVAKAADAEEPPAAKSVSLLSTPYRDEVAGFQMQPPKGMQMKPRVDSHLPPPTPGADTNSTAAPPKPQPDNQLVLFESEERDWTLVVWLDRRATPTQVDAMLQESTDKLQADAAKINSGTATNDLQKLMGLNKTNAGGKQPEVKPSRHVVTITERRTDVLRGRPVARLQSIAETDMKDRRIVRHRHELIVQATTSEYFRIVFLAPAESKSDAAKTFDAVAESFEVLNKDEVARQRLAAIKTGREWLTAWSKPEIAKRLSPKPRLYRIKVNNHDVGYALFTESEAVRGGFQGILTTVNSRTFPTRSAMAELSEEAFWAYPKQPQDAPRTADTGRRTPKTRILDPEVCYHLWSRRFDAILSSPDPNRPARVSQRSNETGVVLSEYRPKVVDPKEKRVELQPMYYVRVTRDGDGVPAGEMPHKWYLDDTELPPVLPKVFEALWPRLVDLNATGSGMGFSGYDPLQVRMGLRTLKILGPETLPLNGMETPTIRLAEELGGLTTYKWVTPTGEMVKMVSPDGATLTPTTEEEMQRMWSARLAAPANAPQSRP